MWSRHISTFDSRYSFCVLWLVCVHCTNVLFSERYAWHVYCCMYFLDQKKNEHWNEATIQLEIEAKWESARAKRGECKIRGIWSQPYASQQTRWDEWCVCKQDNVTILYDMDFSPQLTSLIYFKCVFHAMHTTKLSTEKR